MISTIYPARSGHKYLFRLPDNAPVLYRNDRSETWLAGRLMAQCERASDCWLVKTDYDAEGEPMHFILPLTPDFATLLLTSEGPSTAKLRASGAVVRDPSRC